MSEHNHTEEGRADCTANEKRDIPKEERERRVKIAACKAYQLFVGHGLKYEEAYTACNLMLEFMKQLQLTQLPTVDEMLAEIRRESYHCNST